LALKAGKTYQEQEADKILFEEIEDRLPQIWVRNNSLKNGVYYIPSKDSTKKDYCHRKPIIYIGDLVRLTEKELYRFLDVGPKTVDSVRQELKKVNLSLGMKLSDNIIERLDKLKQNIDKFDK
jgi:DNA-directed RNA polymerase alpha subunit